MKTLNWYSSKILEKLELLEISKKSKKRTKKKNQKMKIGMQNEPKNGYFWKNI